MANIRVKDLPNTSAPAADTDEFIIDSSSAGTRRLNYGELKTAISGDFQSGTTTYKVATLGSDNKLDPAQIPDTLSQGLNFVGVANSAGDLTSTTQGDFYVIQTAFGSYNVGDQAVYDGSAYIRVTDGTKEISEGGTGATTLDAAKVNLEIIDVGTAPNEVPLNGQLGSMAYQSADSVSMGVVEADSLDVGGQSKAGSLVVYDANGNASNSLDVTYSGSSGVANIQADSSGGSTALTFGTSNAGVVGTRMTIDSSGRVGIGTASPGSYYTGTDDLVVAGASGDRGITIATPNTANGGLMFADSDSTTIGRIQYSHGTNEMKFRVNNTEVWSINSSGNLVANGTAIDFGSGASLSNYEEGTHTTTMTTTSSGTITLDSSADRLGYIIIGKHVAITGRLNVSAVSSPSGALVITLPTIPANLTEVAGSGGGCCAYYDNSAAVTWSNVPIVWDEGSSNLYIRIDASTVAASDEFRFSFVYRTT